MTHPPDDAASGSSEQLTLVERMAEEYLARLRDGETPSISEYTAAHPELADEIRDIFSTLEMMEGVAPSDAEEVAPAEPRLSAPRQLGEYRIIRELGRGGMGVVYEAEHATMRRRVALKVLFQGKDRKGHDLERFLREARAAGRLHHTNIVPVFEVGADQGMHFYAMQRIRGQNLDLVIEDLDRLQHEEIGPHDLTRVANVSAAAERLHSGRFQSSQITKPYTAKDFQDTKTIKAAGSSTKIILPDSSEMSNVGEQREGYFHRVARVGLQVAEALSYAHDHGVLHRDIKPSNLLLDTSGTVWVTDFGLARSEGEELTHTGDIVGTLRYMAPERFKGKADARSDIYSLGLTLYELCTLRRAFEREDPADLIRHVMSDEPRPPTKINAAIPRDLETIILKSIAREPLQRYQNAAMLAEDLRLFLGDRPIQARRTSFFEQSWRWCRRNPSIAALLSCVFLLLAVVFAGAIVFAVRTQQYARDLSTENTRVVALRQAEAEAHKESRANLYRAFYRQVQAEGMNQFLADSDGTMSTLKQAIEILPELGFDEAQLRRERLALRNLATAQLARASISPDTESMPKPLISSSVKYGHGFDRYAVSRGNIQIRRISDDELLQTAPQFNLKATDVEFSSDGRLIATLHRQQALSPRFVRVWDLNNNRPLLEVAASAVFIHLSVARGAQLPRLAFISMATDPDSPFVSSVTVYDLNDISKPWVREFDYRVRQVHFSPDAEQLAITGDTYGAFLWSLADDEVSPFLTKERTAAIDWCPHTNLLALGYQAGLIHIFDMKDPKRPPLILRGHTDLIRALSLTADSEMLVSMAWDTTTRLWDVHAEQQLKRLEHTTLGTGMSHDGAHFSCRDADGLNTVFRIQRSIVRKKYFSHRSVARMHELCFHPTIPHLAALATSFHVEFWDLRRKKIVHLMEAQRTFAARFSSDGKRLITTGRGGVRRWKVSIPDPESLADLTVNAMETLMPNDTYQVASTGDMKRVAYVLQKGPAQIWNEEEPEKPISLQRHGDLHGFSISPDGNWLITDRAAGRGATIWNAKTGEPVADIATDLGIGGTAFSADGKRLLGNCVSKRRIWRVGSWDVVAEADRVGREVKQAAYSPNGRLIAVSRDRYSIELVDAWTLETLVLLEDSRHRAIESISFSPESERLAVVFNQGFEVWDLKALRGQLSELSLDW